MNDRNPRRNFNQAVLQSKIRLSQGGTEMLDFVIPLGLMELHCSCSIPAEGTDEAPVYVHMRMARPNGHRRPEPQVQSQPLGDPQDRR